MAAVSTISSAAVVVPDEIISKNRAKMFDNSTNCINFALAIAR